jgi:hypothetical protein
VKRAGLSILVPGLGQLLQGRQVAAALQFSTVILAALDATSSWGIALAVASRLVSGCEAYLHEPSPEPEVNPNADEV